MSLTGVSTTESYDPDLGDSDGPVRVCIKKAELVPRGYKNFLEWKADPSHLYVGRNMDFYVKGATRSKWCNPYKIKPDGPYSLDESLEKYMNYIRGNEDLIGDVQTILEYKEIGCWCQPGERCHGDILIELARETDNHE